MNEEHPTINYTDVSSDRIQNDRYRDYSPGDVVIKTPNIPNYLSFSKGKIIEQK